MSHPLDARDPTEGERERIVALKEIAKRYYDALHAYAVPSRERSLALTKLEEASMWSTRAVLQSKPPPALTSTSQGATTSFLATIPPPPPEVVSTWFTQDRPV